MLKDDLVDNLGITRQESRGRRCNRWRMLFNRASRTVCSRGIIHNVVHGKDSTRSVLAPGSELTEEICTAVSNENQRTARHSSPGEAVSSSVRANRPAPACAPGYIGTRSVTVECRNLSTARDVCEDAHYGFSLSLICVVFATEGGKQRTQLSMRHLFYRSHPQTQGSKTRTNKGCTSGSMGYNEQIASPAYHDLVGINDSRGKRIAGYARNSTTGIRWAGDRPVPERLIPQETCAAMQRRVHRDSFHYSSELSSTLVGWLPLRSARSRVCSPGPDGRVAL